MISSFLVSFSDPSLETELAIEIEHLRFEWHSWSLNRSLLLSSLDFGIAVQGNRKKERKENGLRGFSFFRVSRRRVVFEAQKHRKEIRSTRAKEDDARTLIVLVEVWIRKKKISLMRKETFATREKVSRRKLDRTRERRRVGNVLFLEILKTAFSVFPTRAISLINIIIRPHNYTPCYKRG